MRPLRYNLLTYLCPSLPVEHRPSTTPPPPPPPSPAIALCSGLLLSFRTSWFPAVSALLQCLASSCCEAGLSSSSPAGSRSGLGVWCWMLEGVSDPAPFPPQYLLGHWFLSRSLPQISLATWTVFPVSYIVLMFHVASRVNALGVRRGVSLSASFRLSLHCVISLLDGDPSLPR